MDRVFAHIFFMFVVVFSQTGLASGIQSRAYSLFLKSLNSHINGTLDSQSFEFKPPSTFIFRKLSIKDTSGREIIFAEVVKGSFSLMDLLSGDLRFNAIEIIAPRINSRIIDGVFDLSKILKTQAKSEESSPISFKKIVVSDATLTLTTPKDSFRVENLSFETGAFTSRMNKLQVQITRSHFRSEALPLSAEFSGALDLSQGPSSKESTLLLTGALNRLSAYQFRINEASNFKLTLRQVKQVVTLEQLQIKNSALDVEAHGTIDLDTNAIAGKILTKVSDTQNNWNDPNTKLSLSNVDLDTNVTGSLTQPILSTSGTVDWEGINFTGILSLDVSSKKVSGSISATSLENNLSLKPFTEQDLFISNLNGAIVLEGSLDDLVAKGKVRCSRLYTSSLKFGKCDLPFHFRNDSLSISGAILEAAKGTIIINSMIWSTKTGAIDGKGSLEQLDVLEFLPQPLENSSSSYNALVSFSGTVKDPKVVVDGKFQNLTLMNNDFGEVPTAINYGVEESHTLQIIAQLSHNQGSIDFRSAFNAQKKTTNTLLEFDKFNIDSLLGVLNPWLQFGSSSVSGQVKVQGSISNPTADLNLVLKADQEDPELKQIYVNLTASLLEHNLTFMAKADVYCEPKENEPCIFVPIFLKGTGTVLSFDNYQIKYDGVLKSDDFENISDFLHKESIELRLNMEVSGSLSKRPGSAVQSSASATFHEIVADLPNILPIKLVEPFNVKWSPNDFSIDPDARFTLTDGTLSIGGNLRNNALSLHLDGRIPLLITRILTREIVEATGLASGAIHLSGDPSKPLLTATLTPDKGATISLRSLPSELTFEEGSIKVGMLPTQRGFLRANLNALRLKIADGFALINGFLNFDLLAQRPEDTLQEVDVSFVATDLSLALPDLILDSDIVDLRLLGTQNKHRLSGKVRIGSGKLTQLFVLNNFELQPVRKPRPADQQLQPFLDSIEADIELDITSFDLLASLVVFDFTGNASGNLQMTGTLSRPRVSGSMELNEGLLDFPAVDFDIPSTTIKFKPSSEKMFAPELHLKANAELPMREFGLTQETSVELSLDGDLDRMVLNLETVSGDRKLDRLNLLYRLLNPSFGSSPEADLLLLKPLTLELEKLISRLTKTRFRIGASLADSNLATTFQWRLNSRLELEGSTSTSQLGLQEARFKLHLFDHLPVGKSLFLEGRFSFLPAEEESARGSKNLKLNYRLVEQ